MANHRTMSKTKIAVICQDDKLWSLYSWNKVFREEETLKEYDFVGFWNCKEVFTNIKKENVWKWYITVFGIPNFFKLGMFAVLYKVSFIYNSIFNGYYTSFKSLCKGIKLPHFETKSPNSPEFIKWVKENEIDILIIMVGHILKDEILNAPKICTLNKHAGLLPSSKGVFPYFWSIIKEEKQGISFHIVNKEIDEGILVYQERVTNPKIVKSMISFYFYCYREYGKMLLKSLRNINENIIIDASKDSISSYHSLPDRKDYVQFRRKKGEIITISDLFLFFKF